MPTRHRRIGIVRDSEVEAALSRAREALGADAPDATVARELIVRGAKALAESAGAEDDLRRWLVERFDARLAKRPLGEVLDEIEPLPMDPDDPYKATRILEELREDSV